MTGTCACGKTGLIKRGMCSACYTRWRRGRTPEQKRRPTVEERFKAKYVEHGPDDCWTWTGSADARTGHGEFHVSVERGRVKAQSFALELATGKRCPEGQGGLHHCDNPPCVNPAHVYYGTQKQNAADMVERQRHQIGEQRPNARLTSEQVVEIRERFAGGETFTVLRAEFGLTSGAVSNIVNGKNWKYAGGPIQSQARRGARPKAEREQVAR